VVEGGWAWVCVGSVLAVETVVVPVCQPAADSNCSDRTYPIYPADMSYVSVVVSQEVLFGSGQSHCTRSNYCCAFRHVVGSAECW